MLLGPTSIAILLLSLLSVLTTAIGALLALLIRENVRAIALGIGFSTGIMLLVSAMELVLKIDRRPQLSVSSQIYEPIDTAHHQTAADKVTNVRDHDIVQCVPNA